MNPTPTQRVRRITLVTLTTATTAVLCASALLDQGESTASADDPPGTVSEHTAAPTTSVAPTTTEAESIEFPLLAEHGETWVHPNQGWTTICDSDDGARLYDFTPDGDVTPVCLTDDDLADTDGLVRLSDSLGADS